MTTAPTRRTWLPPLVVVGTALLILMVFNPWLLLSATTPSGGDMGAHVLGPAFLRDTLLPEGRVMGWSNDWFAGFPAFYFYFPLPSLVIVLLDVVLPYGVAFKLVTVAGVVALPAAVYFLTKAMGFPSPVAAVTAAGGAAFAFMESYSIYGGNIASTLAGEFSYAWSFSLGFVYLGLLIKTLYDDRRYAPWAAVVFALTALSHILTTLVLVVASVAVFLGHHRRERAVGVWVWAFALAGFWAVPLIARIGITSDMAWTPLSRWEEVFPIELWLALPVAVAGMVWARRRTPRVSPLIAATVVGLVYYPIPGLLRSLADTSPAIAEMIGDGRFKLWNGRLLPYWYFGVIFFACLAVGGFVLWATRRTSARLTRWWVLGAVVLGGGVGTGLLLDSNEIPAWGAGLAVALTVVILALVWWLGPSRVATRSLLTGLAAGVVALGATAGVTFVDGWARWNYSGYEGKEAWPEYQSLMQTIDGLPPGRVLWEANSDLDRYGTPMALMLIPYWTGEHPSMEGLYFESSLTTPFHFLLAGEMSHRPSNPIPGLDYHTFSFDRGIEHLELFGVSYYVAFTDEAKVEAADHPGLERVAVSPPFEVYRTRSTALVEPATYQPAVYESEQPGSDTFGDFALDWYGQLDTLDRWVVLDGPDDWPQVSAVEEVAALPALDGGGEVTGVEATDHRISFRTTAVGVPHLVKVSYFPNWQATGAEGPWRATPSLMVVVPTQQQVVLEFGNTWAEWVGWGFTLGGLLALAGWAVWRRSGGEQAADSPQPDQGARHPAEKRRAGVP